MSIYNLIEAIYWLGDNPYFVLFLLFSSLFLITFRERIFAKEIRDNVISLFSRVHIEIDEPSKFVWEKFRKLFFTALRSSTSLMRKCLPEKTAPPLNERTEFFSEKLSSAELEERSIDLKTFGSNFSSVLEGALRDSRMGELKIEPELKPESYLCWIKISQSNGKRLPNDNIWRDLGETADFLVKERMVRPGFKFRQGPWTNKNWKILEFVKSKEEVRP